LILSDAMVGIDFLGKQVRHDFNGTLAKDIPLEDVGQAGLRVDGKNQHFVALLGQPVGGSCTEGGLAEPALAAKHDVAAVRVLLEDLA